MDQNKYVAVELPMIDTVVVIYNVNLNCKHLVECMDYDSNNRRYTEYHKNHQIDYCNQLSEKVLISGSDKKNT